MHLCVDINVRFTNFEIIVEDRRHVSIKFSLRSEAKKEKEKQKKREKEKTSICRENVRKNFHSLTLRAYNKYIINFLLNVIESGERSIFFPPIGRNINCNGLS